MIGDAKPFGGGLTTGVGSTFEHATGLDGIRESERVETVDLDIGSFEVVELWGAKEHGVCATAHEMSVVDTPFEPVGVMIVPDLYRTRGHQSVADFHIGGKSDVAVLIECETSDDGFGIFLN